MKVLIEVGSIPDGAVVTKRTGEKEYNLYSTIKFYALKGLQDVKAIDGAKFLCADDGNISIVSETTVVCWHVEEQELFEYLRECIEGPEQ